MEKAKVVSVSMTDTQKKKAEQLSIKMFGKKSISAIVNYLILKEEKEQSK